MSTFEEFIQWLLPLLPPVTGGLWRLLLLDGFGPHTMSPTALGALAAARISVVVIPPHTSHVLQLPVSFAGVVSVGTYAACTGRCHFWTVEKRVSSSC